MSESLTDQERIYLLQLARQTIGNALRGPQPPSIVLADLTPALRGFGASFVTLTLHGHLRGCIGTLTAYQPLAQDVRQRAYQAAFEDYRFPSMTDAEFQQIAIEISRLTAPRDLAYDSPDTLLAALTPGVDGVVLRDGLRSATFLPQVWGQLPDPAEFLSHLCQKMGAPADAWQKKTLQVLTYSVEEFSD
ncbi:MAG: AmmeMemoRadiSam system protein A [Anaerolineaceae bacterium]|nr:AmmeMemoRadiSam system protein A [Anaerolineaceae bacterium]